MNRMFSISIAILTVFFAQLSQAAPEETAVLEGMVIDREGMPVKGARVFVYDGPNVKRQADFISPLTGEDGKYRIVLPRGRYWTLARLKKAQGYGPLMQGDKHSGEPAVIDLAAVTRAEVDFAVADLRDALRSPKKPKDGYARITGKILDGSGLPAGRAYVVAHRSDRTVELPDFISAWSDEDGSYTLYVPRGEYWLGSLSVFPPDPGIVLKKKVLVEVDLVGLDFVMNTGNDEKK